MVSNAAAVSPRLMCSMYLGMLIWAGHFWRQGARHSVYWFQCRILVVSEMMEMMFFGQAREQLPQPTHRSASKIGSPAGPIVIALNLQARMQVPRPRQPWLHFTGPW
jgi:hypothetical protein